MQRILLFLSVLGALSGCAGRPRHREGRAQAVLEAMRASVAARAQDYKACYELELDRHGRERRPTGGFSLRIEIQDGGKIATSALREDTLHQPRVANCVRRVVEHIDFSGILDPDGRNSAAIVYPFVFK
jgi:hypothetical protein